LAKAYLKYTHPFATISKILTLGRPEANNNNSLYTLSSFPDTQKKDQALFHQFVCHDCIPDVLLNISQMNASLIYNSMKLAPASSSAFHTPVFRVLQLPLF
jgi:hypothetical protein